MLPAFVPTMTGLPVTMEEPLSNASVIPNDVSPGGPWNGGESGMTACEPNDGVHSLQPK
jgi:hypothetical protein